mmetsp:Transcript_688/g.1597  ORF Transcript_688/g.1597 Transcript_688/m.1597 type:complete len:183 (+) Transcript_688:144-692(+)
MTIGTPGQILILLIAIAIGCYGVMMETLQEKQPRQTFRHSRFAKDKTPEELFHRWFHGFTKDTFGMPLPKPTIVQEGDDNGVGTAVRKNPVGLIERVVATTKEPPGHYSVEYVAVNGGFRHFFPVKEYTSRVTFTSDGKGTTIVWESEWIALPLCGKIISWMVHDALANHSMDFLITDGKEE